MIILRQQASLSSSINEQYNQFFIIISNRVFKSYFSLDIQRAKSKKTTVDYLPSFRNLPVSKDWFPLTNFETIAATESVRKSHV